jgi:hypothetical protein
MAKPMRGGSREARSVACGSSNSATNRYQRRAVARRGVLREMLEAGFTRSMTKLMPPRHWGGRAALLIIHCHEASLEPGQTALVFAGGVGLGASQAGAYAALAKHGVAPHWLAGSSVGR